jgi:predicted SnoaL-like aldol condensation-catalyzing enzyme
MSKAIEEKNKALVLEAFDTLFNRRDYIAAERYWSPNYIQHSAHIAPGREGLFNLIKSMPLTLIFLNMKRFNTAIHRALNSL